MTLSPFPAVPVEKRLPLALILCCLIMMGWSIMFPPKDPGGLDEKKDTQAPSAVEQAPEVDLAPAAEALISEATERTIEVEFGRRGERGNYQATFTNKGGRLLSLRIGGEYDQHDLTVEEQEQTEHWVELLRPVRVGAVEEVASFGMVAQASSKELFDVPLDTTLWKMEEIIERRGEPPVGVRFTYGSSAGVVLTKEFWPRRGERIIDFVLGLENVSAAGASGLRQFTLTPAACIESVELGGMYRGPRAVGGWREKDGEMRIEVEEQSPNARTSDLQEAFNSTGSLIYAGVQNKFYACLMHVTPESEQTLIGASWRRIPDADWPVLHPEDSEAVYQFMVTDVDLALHLDEVGKKRTWTYEVYAGPKAREELLEASSAYEALTEDDLGFFPSLAQVILAILGFYQGLVGNWGWAIILMTLTVRLCLFPINRRSQTAMARYSTKMKRVQPKIEEIKKKYADNPQKQREEQGRIMQEEGAFPPLGGCLPMFLQIPVFIGLFGALRVEYHLRQEPFLLWIRDLSQPDHLLRLDFNTHLPFIGTIEWLNVLPILMVVLWVLQQRCMPTPTDEQQARMQKMMMWMPVMFGFLLYSYASGLSLYMITSSGLGIIEIRYIKKIWPIDDSEQPTKKGWMMRMAEKQAEQQAGMKKMQQQQQMSRQKAQKARKKRKR